MTRALFTASLLSALSPAPRPPGSPSRPIRRWREGQGAPPASAPPVRGRAVEFEGFGDGSRISARLTTLADGRIRAEGSTQGAGASACFGAFSGNGRFQGRTRRVQEESLPGCVVTLVRNGRSLVVDAEGRACGGLHGASCSLSGTLTQR